MSKDQTAMKSSHVFSLINIKADCYYSSVTADFTPPPSLNKASNSIVPAFLDDKNFFTPAFIIPRDKEYFVNTLAFEKEKFQARILKANRLCEEYSQKKQNVAEVSLPVPTTNYCQICKNSYSSYQEHLKDVSHKRQSRFSKANTYISQLSKKYSKNKPKLSNKYKTKTIGKAMAENSMKKAQRSRSKNPKRVAQNQQLIKMNNQTTNIPSVIPTPYC